MARLTTLRITNYRSISEQIEIRFPAHVTLVLLGENNAGKSNITKAMNLLLGPFWPGNYEPDDNEFFDRDHNRVIEIHGQFADAPYGGRYTDIVWRYDHAHDERVFFKGAPGQRGYDYGFIKTEDRDTCTCIVIEAERNLRYQLGYSSKWTFLSRLMHRFHDTLRRHPQIRQDLEQSFEQIKASFRQIPEFAHFTTALQEHFTQLVGSMTHRLDVDFEAYNPANFFHALELQASENGQPRTIDEMGTGEQQVLAMAFAHAFARAFHGGIILVVEEPESHLHPLAQHWLAQQLGEMCSDGLQVVITTHSPHFVNILGLEGLALVKKVGGGTQVVQKSVEELVAHCVASGVPVGRTTGANILPFYLASSTLEIRSGFFAKAVVLVEGPTESLCLPAYLSQVGLNTAKEGIAVIPVHGKGNLAKWRRLFTAYGLPCYVIFDNDGRDDDRTATKRRDALTAVGIAVADSGQYLNTNEWLVEDGFAVFGANFERALRAQFPEYASLEATAAQEGVDSKQFIARFVAERLPKDEAPGWGKFQELAEKLRSLVGVVPPARVNVVEPAMLQPQMDDDIPF